MSRLFSSSDSSGSSSAREPLLSRTGTPETSPATVPRPSSFFGRSDFSPVLPFDSGFDRFHVQINPDVQLNVLGDPDMERDIVTQFLLTNSTDPEVIYKKLKIPFQHSQRDKSVKELKRSIVRVLDEIILYREGCSQIQIDALNRRLTLLDTEASSLAAAVQQPKMEKVTAFFKKPFESPEEKSKREATEKKIKEQKERQEEIVRESDLLRRRILHCQQRKPVLVANSLLSKFDANDARECAFVKYCRDHFGETVNDLCGRATITPNPREMSGGIIDIPVPLKIKFELKIAGDGSNSDTTSVHFTEFCRFVSPDSHQFVSFDVYYEDNVEAARQIEEDVKNALFNQFRSEQVGPDVVETHGLEINALEPKQCSSVGRNDRELPNPDDSCCMPFCKQQGGAKKIKRTRQSKKKKTHRSKSKSKKARRKNKSRRN